MTATPVRHHAAPDGLVAAVLLSFLATAGIFYINIMPALVSGLVDGLGFSARDAGLVGSANVYGAAFGALAITFAVARLQWRRTAIALLVLLIAVDLVSRFVITPWPLIALRAAHGFIGGMLVGVAFAVIARTRAPDRVFGVLLLVQFGLGGLGVMTLPRLVPDFGHGVLFMALVAFSAVTLAMVPFLADYPPRGVPAAGASAAASTDASAVAAPAGRIASRPQFALALLALFLFQASNMGLFSYILELGKDAGLAASFVASAVGAATWVGTAGCLLVIVIGTRFGRALPLAIALAVTVIGLWGLHYAGNATVFVLANCVTGITWSLVMPYLLGLSAAFDTTGRAAALGGFASKMGLASGPLLGALVLGDGNYALLINLSCLGILACAAAALLPARLLDRRLKPG